MTEKLLRGKSTAADKEGMDETVSTLPRKPSRGRGVKRYSALLQATEDLLLKHDPDSVGLYQIAEQAQIPPASVYHFFPSKEAAFLGLCQRYLDDMEKVLAAPIPARDISSWQDVLRIDTKRSMDFHNAHPPMMKINYYGFGGTGSKKMDAMFSSKLAAINYNRLNSIFHMPALRDAADFQEMEFAIIDGIWGISYRRHGEITERYFEESLNAAIAFKSQFLPSRLDLREVLVEAAKKGQMIALPPEADGSVEVIDIRLPRVRVAS